MEFTNQIGCLLLKLQEALMEGTQVQQKHEEILQSAVEEIAILKMQLGKEREEHKKTKTELKYARMEMADKDKQIREMEDFLLNQEVDGSEYGESDFGEQEEVEESEESASDGDEEFSDQVSTLNDSGFQSSESKFVLYTIPEENPEEIPDYYDACIAYAKKLRIVIGSDLKSSTLTPVLNCEVKEDNEKKKLNSVIITSKQDGGKKKRKQLKTLFCMAHY